MESDENQAEIEEGKDVESIKEEVKEADQVDKDAQLVKTPFLQEAQQDEDLRVLSVCFLNLSVIAYNSCSTFWEDTILEKGN